MNSRAQTDAELQKLADMLPYWLLHLRHEAQFWPQFDALAQMILREAGKDDLPYVHRRLDEMLEEHAGDLAQAHRYRG
jgi:hypothetical protein